MTRTGKKQDNRRLDDWLAFGAWFLVLVGGYLYVAGVLCGRSNPFLSGNGTVLDLLIVLALSPVFYLLGPRHNWRPAQMTACSVLEWNGLCYVIPFFLALHWEYFGNALGATFSLKSADLGSLEPRSAAVLAIAFCAIAGLLIVHLLWARRAGILRSYLAALVGIPAVVGIITVSLGNTAYLHVHHYFLGAFLFPFFRFRRVPSLVAQAVFLGLVIEGISRWGMDPIWYAVT